MGTTERFVFLPPRCTVPGAASMGVEKIHAPRSCTAKRWAKGQSRAADGPATRDHDIRTNGQRELAWVPKHIR